MPGLYAGGDYDLAGFSVGAVERDALLPRPDIGEGDVLLALASSGVHSNGFSLVRRIVSDAGLGVGRAGALRAGPSARRRATGTDAHLREGRRCRRSARPARSRRCAHITGGGLTENLPRVLPEGLAGAIDLDTFDLPPVFGWLAAQGDIANDEMLRTFNCGVGMVVVAAAEEEPMPWKRRFVRPERRSGALERWSTGAMTKRSAIAEA